MINTPLIILLVALLASQAGWIFVDAKRRGENAILWAIFGLLNVPSSLIIYLLVTRIGKRKCTNCIKIIEKKYNFCPFCNTKQNSTCSKCNYKIEDGWDYCPNCSNKAK